MTLEKQLKEIYENISIKLNQQVIVILTNPDGTFQVMANCDKETLKSNLINTASQVK